MKKTAKNFHVSLTNLTKDIEEAIVDGISSGKALYQKTIEIMLSKIKNLSCDQLINTDVSFFTKLKKVNNSAKLM